MNYDQDFPINTVLVTQTKGIKVESTPCFILIIRNHSFHLVRLLLKIKHPLGSSLCIAFIDYDVFQFQKDEYLQLIKIFTRFAYPEQVLAKLMV